jgi:aldehyde dehydrogenase (NAD+)
MTDTRKFYIDGRWVDPVEPRTLDVINPATEEAFATISIGGSADVDKAVAAASKAFERFSNTTREDRLALLRSIVEIYTKRQEQVAETITREMGAPLWFSKAAQARTGLGHLAAVIDVVERYQFERMHKSTMMRREPIGVCGFITPWNWPINQIATKVVPALAAGCTMVLKPSEVAPLSAHLWAEILEEAGVPAGVFNLVDGDGAGVGQAISSHPGIDMVSFTGSTRAGIAVATAAAPTVKRVTQELGGKSANIVLDDADLKRAVTAGVQSCFYNSGQSCNAPSRMLVTRKQHDEAVEIAKEVAESVKVGDPMADGVMLGPVVSDVQFKRIQGLIHKGIDEGAKLVAGGTGRPDGLARGYFVRPTVFADVDNDMTIAREEIFGPVLSILPYGDEEEAVRIANDTVYGLSGYVQSSDIERARRVAKRLRSGNVHINGAPSDFAAAFGGYKQSGNGREWGEAGFEEFLELKAIFGYEPPKKPPAR